MNKEFFVKNKIKILIAVLAVIILVAGVILAVKISNNKNNAQQPENTTELQVVEEEKEERNEGVKIYSGTERPVAVMIDNHSGAWPQGGLNKTYME